VMWSPPSGAALLVRARTGGGDSVDLFLVEPDGTGLRPLGLPGTSPLGPDVALSGAAFSPDGMTIAYNSIETEPGRAADTVNHFRIRLVGSDGTNGRAVIGPTDPYVQEGWPAYSPDGRWILVHRWVFKKDGRLATPEGWLAIMPADGSAPARDIGPRIPGGEDSGLSKLWSPDGSRVLVRADNTQQVFSIDPVTGAYEDLAWTTELPDWQRIAPP
jgi:Tol biopolymer transport system component